MWVVYLYSSETLARDIYMGAISVYTICMCAMRMGVLRIGATYTNVFGVFVRAL